MTLSIRLFRWVAALLFLYGGVAQAQTITITAVNPNPVCAGAAVTVTYVHTFTGTGTYTLYLYNANGSAVSAKGPTTLNWVPGAYSDNLSIPAGLPTGTYTVGITRVSATNATYNSPRSAGFTVNAVPPAPGVTNLAYCQGTTGVPPLTATGQNLKWYSVNAGGVGSTTAPTPPTSTVGSTNYYVSQTSNGCEGPRATLTVTINPLPNAPTTTNISYCQNATAAPLTASGQNLRWYTAASGGTPSTTVTPLTTTAGSTTYYVSQTDNNSCESARTPLTVTINATPPAPTVANTSVAYCQNTTAQPLQATATSGNTLNWYNSQGTALGSSAPTPSTTNPGTTFYQVSQRSASGCESARVQITVTINTLPPAPATSPASACQGGAAVSLVNSVTAQPGNTLKWYTSPTSASLAAAPQVSTSTTGSQVFYVSQTNANGCESSRAAITYTVYALPNPPSVVSPVTYCQNAVAQPLQATPSPGGTLNFYTVSSGGTSTTSLTPQTQSSNIYYVSQTVNGCESSTRAPITVTINALPPRPAVTTPVTYCQFATASPLSATASTNNTLVWYSLNGQQIGGAPTPPTTVTGITSYSVSQRDPVSCVSQPAIITVTINAKPTAPVTAPLSACLNTPAPSLPNSVTATGALRWYTAAAGGVGATVAPVLSTTTAGTYTYYVSQISAEGCESDRAAIAFTVNSLPSPPIPTPRTVFYCQGAASTPLTASGQNLKWYLTNTTSVSAISITPSTTIANNVKYYVSQTNANGCESARDSVTVITGSRPVAPTVVSPVTYCQNAVATSLTATAIPTNTLKWYGTDPAGTTFTTQATIPATTTPGTLTYYVTQTDGNGCESDKAGINVTINTLPTTPVTSSLTVCQNAPTVSLPSAVTATGTLKWYTAATGGTGSTTAPVLSTATATTYTYYVSQTNGNGCESSRATLTAIVKPLPAAPLVTRNVVPICQSSTPVPLTAVASPGGTLKWYDRNNNSYASVSPPTDVTGPIDYRVTQIVDGCESASSTTVTAQIIGKPAAPTVGTPPVYCQLDTPISLSATGQNLRWYADPTTTQTIPTPTPSTSTSGTTTYYVTQTDGNGCQSDRASIAVQVKAKPTPPVTVSVAFCANQVSSLTATASAGGTLNWYGTNQTGGMASATAPVPSTSVIGAPINYYVSQTVNGCESDRAAIAVTIKALPVAPTVSTMPVVYCQGVTAQPLSATPATNGMLNWYMMQTGGTSSPTAFTPSTTSSVPPTSYYYVSQTVDGCEGPRATIAVTINPKPTAPIVTPTVTYCQNAIATPLTATASGTLRWYTDPAGSAAIPTPTPSTITPGVTNYYVTQISNNGCESDRSTIVVTINALPTAPVVSQTAVSVCQSSTPVSLTAMASTGGTLNWYTTVNGQPSSTAPAPPTTTAGSTTTYYVSQTVNGCEGPKTAITVTVTALPAAPAVSTPVNYCQNAVAQPLSATPATGGTLNWYNPGGTALGSTTPTPSTTIAGPQTYAVSQIVNGCEGPKATITVIINQAPASPATTTVLAYCQSSVAPALTATGSVGGTINWYTTAGGPASSIAPIPNTTTAGVQTYYVSQTVNGCESDKVTVTVTIKATPAAPVVASPTISLCQGSASTPLTATPATGGSLNWYTTVGGPSSPIAPSPNTTTAGTQVYYVSQTVDGCESPTTMITITVNALPAAPVVATASVRFCQNSTSTALTALASPGGTLYWYTGAGGTGSTTAPVPPTNSVGTQTYLVSQRVNGCEGPQTAITVTIDPLPAAPTTSPTPITYCQGVTALPLTATPATGGTLNWYTVAGGAPSQTPPTPPTTTPGLFTYYVSQSVNGCDGPQAAIVVLINATPVAPTAGASPIYCQNGTSTALAAIPSSGGTLNWYTTATGGSPSNTPPTPPVGSAGTVTYYVSQSISGCEGPRIELTATIKPSPAAPTVTPTLTYCQNSVAPALTATPSAGTLNWYTVPTGGTGSATPPVPPTNTVGTQSYYVSQITADGCEGARAAIAVTIRALPAAPTTTPLTICQNATPPSLIASVAAIGQVNWYLTQTGGTPSAVAPVPATASPGPITYYVSQIDASGCESQRALLLVTITPTPAAPVVPTTAPVCQGTAPIVLSAAGQGLKWYADATSTGSLGSSVIVPTTAAGTYSYYVSQTVSNCEGPRALAQVVVNATPAAPVVQGVQSGCQDAPAQPLTASGTALQWYNAADELIGTPTPDTRVEATQTYTYKVAQTINGCVSPKATVLYTVTVLPVPTVTTPAIYCQNQVATPLQASGSGLRWIDPSGAVTNVAPTPPTSVVTAGASYSVSQTNAQGCESRRAEIRVTVNAQAVAVLSGMTTVSLGETAPLTLTLSGVGPYSYTLSNGLTGVAESTTSATITRTVSVTPTATTTYTLLGVSNGCGAGLASGSATVTVNTPSIITGTLSTSTVCAGGQIDVPFAISGTFTPGNTFVVEIAAAGELATRQFTAISTGSVQGSSITTRIPTTFSQGLYLVRVRATNSNYPIISDPSATTLNVRALPTGRISTVNSVVLRGNRVQLDFTFSGDAPWSARYLDRTGVREISTSTTPYSVTFTADSSTTYRLLSVANECGPGRIDGVDSVRIRVDRLLADETPFATSVKVYPIPANDELTVEIDDPMLKNEAELLLIRPNGQTAQSVKTRKRQTIIKLSDEPAGTYLLQIKLGDRSTVRRVLKW